MKSLSILFSLVFIINISTAQINPDTKWGKVSQNEWNYTTVSFEKEAPVVILFEQGKTEIAQYFTNKIYRRIKILNEDGLEAANQEFLYYSYKNLEKVGSIKAQTLNLENGIITSYEVDKKDFFDVNENEYYNKLKFTFPNVKVGSILEYEYTFYDEKLYLIDAWEFQHEYPTIYSDFEIKNNSSLDYSSIMIGEKIVKHSKEKKSNENTQWTLKNIPSYTTISYLHNPKDMAERIVFQLRGYYSNTRYIDAISKWPELSKELLNDYRGKSNDSYVHDLASTIPNGKTEKETLLNVYKYMKSYTWNKFKGIYPRLNNKEVEKSKKGNAADLNLLLNRILVAKGFNSELIILSTRENGKIISGFPYLGQFDLLANLVYLNDGSSYMIDASYLENDLGYMPLRNYNVYAFILEEKKENFVELNQLVSEYSTFQHYKFKDGKFFGSRLEKMNGYFKVEYNGPEGLDKGYILNYSLDLLTNEQNRQTKIGESEESTVEKIIFETVEMFGAKFINIQNPLKNIISDIKLNDEERERPLEFSFPVYFKSDVAIEIPEGYTIEIPTSYKSQIENSSKNLVYFQNAEVKNGNLLLHVEYYMGKSMFEKGYHEIKSFFEKANLDVQKTVILKKI